jgi:hypothetical protein
VQQAAQEKLEREAKDSEYAAKLSLEIEESEAHMKEIQREHDELLAKDAYELLQDEALAEELQRREQEEEQVLCLLKAEASEADEKVGKMYLSNTKSPSRNLKFDTNMFTPSNPHTISTLLLYCTLYSARQRVPGRVRQGNAHQRRQAGRGRLQRRSQ